MESRVQPHSQAQRRYEKSVVVPKAVTPYLWLCALVLAGILPFVSRAVYTDEPQYLHVAHSAIENDWRFPQDTSWTFFGKTYSNLSGQTHLPAVEYYLAVLLKLFGQFDAVSFRLCFAVFPLLAIVSFYRIAKRFTSNPFIVSCLFAFSPAFFVLSPSLMMDIPMLAFLLAGLSIHLDAVETGKQHSPPRQGQSRRRRQGVAHTGLWLSSTCFVLAAGTGYTALIPIACLLIWTVSNRRPIREWISVGVAPIAVVIWITILRLHVGEWPTNEMVGYYTSHSSVGRIVLPMFSFVGGVALFPWAYVLFVEKFRFRAVVAFSVAGAFVLSLFYRWPSVSHRLWFVCLASSGIGLLMLFAVKSLSGIRREKPPASGFLILWLPSVLLFLLLFSEMISARYVLLALPPLFLVVFDRIRLRPAMWAVTATAALSLALAIADYRFVNSYPRWVSNRVVPVQKQGFRFWNAAESGLRFYLEERGIRTLDRSDIQPRGGDLIVRQSSFSYGLANELEPLLVPVFKEDLPDRYPVRTFSRDAGAGFHDSHLGIVPFTISYAPLDRLEIWEVSPFVMDLPQVVPSDFSSVPLWFPGGVLLKQTESEMKFRVRLPGNAKVKYELEGQASVTWSTDTIVLRKESTAPAIWKNFRIIPDTWID